MSAESQPVVAPTAAQLAEQASQSIVESQVRQVYGIALSAISKQETPSTAAHSLMLVALTAATENLPSALNASDVKSIVLTVVQQLADALITDPVEQALINATIQKYGGSLYDMLYSLSVKVEGKLSKLFSCCK